MTEYEKHDEKVPDLAVKCALDDQSGIDSGVAIVDEVKKETMATIDSIGAFEHEYAAIQDVEVGNFVADLESENGGQLNWWQLPQAASSGGSLYKLGDDHFDVHFLPEVPEREFDGVSIAKVVVVAFKAVEEAYLQFETMLRKKIGVDDDKPPFFSFEIDPGNSLSASALGAGPIQIGVQRLRPVIEAYRGGDHQKFKQVLVHFQSQLFHELFHQTPEIDNRDVNDTHEEITMFAEFLFDPQNNRDGNENIFRPHGKNIGKNPSNTYAREYSDVTSKLLLWELYTRGLVAAGLSLEEYSVVLGKIDEYFSKFSLGERLKMIVDVMPCSRESIAARAKEIREKMRLPF